MFNRQSIVGASTVSSRKTVSDEVQDGEPSPDMSMNVISKYFLEFCQAPFAYNALKVLSDYERKEDLTSLHEKYGHWCPPTELAQILNKPPPATRLPDSKEARKLIFVMKMLGCSFRESRPYKQFLKARSLRQKRLWLYKYMLLERGEDENVCEPICPTRMKRLNRFFPDRFSEQNGLMYFNHKAVSFDKTEGVFYIGRTPEDNDDDD